MKAHVGDRLVIRGHRIGEPDRDAQIIDVGGAEGDPPYRVRWSDSGRETIIYPGVDARVEEITHPSDPDGGVGVLGGPARDVAGQPTLPRQAAVSLVRRHAELERLRTTDYDEELWRLWREEVRRASPGGHNAAVLDRVLARVRVGE